LIVEAGEKLAAEGIKVRLVSFPSWELFISQDQAYRDSVLPPEVRQRLAVEAGVAQGWREWVGDEGKVISLGRFGASAPYKLIYQHLGLTVENVIAQARGLLQR
jgi:transketolase